MSTIATLETMVQGELRPDITYILDLAPEIGLQRARQRGELDRFEQEKVEFFNRVREAYLTRASRDPERCVVIDAAMTLESVQTEIRKHLETML